MNTRSNGIKEVLEGAELQHGFFKGVVAAVEALGGDVEDIRRAVDGSSCEEIMRAIAYVIVPGGSRVVADGTILVPDMPAEDLIRAINKEHDVSNELLECYRRAKGGLADILGRGKRYRFQIWRPGRSVSEAEVRNHFAPNGMSGNAGAFLAMLLENPNVVRGYCATLPEEEGCVKVVQHVDESPYTRARFQAPYVFSAGGRNKFDLGFLDGYTGDYYSYAGFREE